MFPEQQAQLQKQAERVMAELDARSEACERGIVAVRNDGHAGIALVGPNCLVLAEAFFSGQMIVDMALN